MNLPYLLAIWIKSFGMDTPFQNVCKGQSVVKFFPWYLFKAFGLLSLGRKSTMKQSSIQRASMSRYTGVLNLLFYDKAIRHLLFTLKQGRIPKSNISHTQPELATFCYNWSVFIPFALYERTFWWKFKYLQGQYPAY